MVLRAYHVELCEALCEFDRQEGCECGGEKMGKGRAYEVPSLEALKEMYVHLCYVYLCCVI